jgi:DNA-binding transcriptional MerR regulator
MTGPRSDSHNLTTEQVAKILGVSKRTLKTWLRIGKVPEPDRNPNNNYRIWTLSDVDAIRLILGSEEALCEARVNGEKDR